MSHHDSKLLKPRSTRPVRRILQYAKPYRWHWFAGLVAILLVSALDAAFVWSVRPLIDHGLARHEALSWVGYLPLALLLGFTFRGVFYCFGEYRLQGVGRHVVADLRADLFERLFHVEFTALEQRTQSDWLTKLIYHVDQVAVGVTDGALAVLKHGTMLLALAVTVAWTSWQLAAMFACFVPIIAWVMQRITTRQRHYNHLVQTSMQTLTQCTQDVLNGLRVWRCHGLHAFWQGRYRQELDHNVRKAMSGVLADSLSSSVIQWMVACPLACGVYLALHHVSHVSLGALLSVMVAVARMLQPAKALSRANADIQRGLAAATDVFAFMDMPDEVDEGVAACAGEQAVVLSRVSVTVPTRQAPVLHDVSGRIEPGAWVAIVGPSGAGKTTLLQVLLRFYRPSSGRIAWGDLPAEQIRLGAWRQRFGFVSQHPVLVRGSIRSNIALGVADEAIDQVRMEEACKQAHVTDFLKALPEGFDTRVGEGGVVLSGGQRQRLALARALYRQAPCLVLDEPTSALDHESEQMFLQSLNNLKGKVTLVVVSHRPALVEPADMVWVMEQGRCVAQAPHATLMSTSALYRSLRASSECV